MSVESVNLLYVIVGVITALGTVVAGFWALAQLVVKQFEKRLDDRFLAQDQARREGSKLYQGRLETLEGEQRKLERAHLQLVGELPIHYVRREDYVRNQSVIEAKLDGLALKWENWRLKGDRDA
jgi:hypothetical protein